MILREFFKSKKIISEGGNLSSQSPGWKGSQDVAADEIDLKVHNRSFMVKLLDKLLHDIDNAFKATYKKSLWSKELLQNKQFLGGSSLHFFNTKGISDEEFVKHKPKVGDIDTQTNKELEPEIEQFLNTITGKKVGDAVFLGFSRGNEQLNGLFQFEDPPIKIQIDFEFGRYSPETNAPDNWYKFSHSSAWNDVQAGIKGVMHKYLYRALAKAGPTTKYVAKLEGRGKARAMSISGPVTDANFSFAVASVGGGGVRAKYKPYIDPETGQEKIIDSIPVMEPVNPADSEYIQNLSQQFELFFNHQPETGDLQLQQSFLGTLDLINKYLDDAAKQNAFKEFLTIVFEPGGQMITANDPARDREVKFAAIDSMIEKLGLGSMRAQSVQMAKDYEQDYHDLEAFKQSNPNEKQPRAAMNRLKKATPVNEAGEVKAQFRKNMPHLRDLKSIDFLDLLDEIHDGNGNFKLENIPLNVKVDGFGGRFGKDAEGKPFMATSNTSPRYAAGFVKYHQDKGTNDPEILGRAKLFDQLFDEMMNVIKLVDSEFGPKFLIDKQVTCEVLFLPFATETPEGKLKFVGIQYDKLPEGVQLALVPFRVVNATSGDDLADAQEIVSKLTSIGQQGSIMFINNSLTQKEGLDVTALVPPLENLEQFKAMLSDPSAGSLKRKQEVAAALEPVKLALEKAISEDPNILGKELLGKDYEGIVINSRLGPIKVTSQTQRDVITAKNAARASARTERPRENNNKTAVVAIGSFIGHKGHEELFSKYTIDKAKEVGGDPYLFIGNAESKDDPIPPAVKVQTWHKLYPEYAKNISTVQEGGQLIQKIKHELINPLPGKPPRYDNIIIMVGEDRAGMNMPTALMKAVNKFQGYEHVKVSLEVTPRGTGISGTALRNSLKNDPPEKALATWSNAFDVNKLGVDWITHLMDITRTGMGIQKLQQPPPQPQQEPLVEQRLFNALVRPLKESTSIESTLRAIINDIGEPITSVYATMKFQAKKYMENHGELGRGFRMVAAGVGGRWVQNMYVGRLHNELYALCKYNTRRTVDLKDFLRGEETDGELEMKRSFSNIANNLPSILSKLGEQLNAPQLTKNAQRWMHNKADYERYIMDLEMDGDDEPDNEPVIKPPKSNVVGQQNAQVDKIINDILSKIPKNIAGEIRNSIARSPNKLSALKQELDKHHLNMAEDTTANMRLWFAGQDQKLPFRAKPSLNTRNYDYPKDIDDILKKIKNREGLSPHEFEYLKRWKSRQGVAEGSLEELANTSLKVKEPKNFVNTNDRKQVVYKVMKFKSGKDTYLINFTVKGAPAFGKKSNWNAVNVSFGVREEQDDYSFGDEINTDLTAKNKNQFLIYSTVINAVRKFITEYNTEIDEIIMQGAGERQAVMYQRFFQSAGKYFPGWHHDGKHSLVRDVPRQTGKKVKEQGVAEARMSAAVKWQRAMDAQRAKSDASLARTPSSIPKPEPKPQDKKVSEKLKTGPAAHFTPKDAHVKRGQFVGGDAGSVDEENTNDDDSVISHMAKNLTGSGSPIAKIRHKRDTEREKRGSISYGYRQDPNLKTTHKQVPFSEDIENIIDNLINKIIVNEAIQNNRK